jgi:hypothetical protein
MKKRLVLLTMLVALLSVVPFDDDGPAMVASKCCADYCGADKTCYYWCVHDTTGGPCASQVAP